MPSTRRQLVQGAGALGATLALGSPARSETHSPTTFVLVHGTWHGGWAWQDVAQILRSQGHRAYTPTCTGCGERIHLVHPDVGLDTHIEDIANLIRFEELDEVILVGHSFAGLTITGVADRLRERIRRIVFLDALVPRPGRMSGVPRDANSGDFPDWWLKRQEKFIDGYQMVMWDEYPVDMLVPPDNAPLVAKLKRLITTHPARQWTDELVLERGGWTGLEPVYIHCVGQKYRMSSELMIGPARGPGWHFIELDTPRDAMLTHPDLVARTLDSLA